MAELVDALVSNTSAARHAGSIPALGTIYTLSTPCKSMIYKGFYFFWGANGALTLRRNRKNLICFRTGGVQFLWMSHVFTEVGFTVSFISYLFFSRGGFKMHWGECGWCVLDTFEPANLCLRYKTVVHLRLRLGRFSGIGSLAGQATKIKAPYQTWTIFLRNCDMLLDTFTGTVRLCIGRGHLP